MTTKGKTANRLAVKTLKSASTADSFDNPKNDF